MEYSGIFLGQIWGRSSAPFPFEKRVNFPNFQLQKSTKIDEIPNFTLAKTCDKNRHAGSLPFLARSNHFKRKLIDISLSLRMLPAQLSLCVPRSKLLIGACCACAVFGDCADDDFLRNESIWVLFLDVLPILASAQFQNCKPVAFRLYFIQSEKPTVNFRLESDFLLSVLLCRPENVGERSILPEKQNFQKSHLQGGLSLKILCPGNRLLIVNPCYQR